jgi:ribosomal protein S6
MSEENKTSEMKLYEVGFHIVPSVNLDKVADEVEKIKKTLTNHKAEIVKEIETRLINLAYQMTKKILDSNLKFDKAYFGSITFNSTSANVELIKSELETNNNILRFLLIKTVDDIEHSTNKIPREKGDKNNAAEVDDVVEETPVEATEVAIETDDVVVADDVDEAIDELVK